MRKSVLLATLVIFFGSCCWLFYMGITFLSQRPPLVSSPSPKTTAIIEVAPQTLFPVTKTFTPSPSATPDPLPSVTPDPLPSVTPNSFNPVGRSGLQLTDFGALPPAPSDFVYNGRWLFIDLQQQSLTVYQNENVTKVITISSGTTEHPTITGNYRVYVRMPTDDMSGEGYHLKDVPWVMYFFEGYGIHGTYWHHNFGQPMSHGCINLSISDAQWLYNYTPLWPPVIIR